MVAKANMGQYPETDRPAQGLALGSVQVETDSRDAVSNQLGDVVTPGGTGRELPTRRLIKESWQRMLRSSLGERYGSEVRVKRVNLLDYFELADALGRAKAACARESAKAGNIYFGVAGLRGRLRTFIDEDNGFVTCKHVARELEEEISGWIDSRVMGGSPPAIEIERFDDEAPNWSYSGIATRADHFRSVLSAECRDVEIYSVGQISIYKTTSLVSSGSHRIPAEYRALTPEQALAEFDNAGRCLAFDLPTACGFHALRAVEVMILHYLDKFGASTGGLRTWNDYIKAVQERIAKASRGTVKPSAKVAAMLDRMRELDRNPLMHPRDTLDVNQADMLFSLAAITATEMARDLEQREMTLSIASSPPKQLVAVGAASEPAQVNG